LQIRIAFGVLNFTMSRHGAGTLCGWMLIDAVFSTFANQQAAVRFQVANQINSLHKSRHGNRDLFPSNFFSTMRLADEFAISLKQKLDCIAQIFTCPFQRFAF